MCVVGLFLFGIQINLCFFVYFYSHLITDVWDNCQTAYYDTICEFSKKWDKDETYYAACKVERQLFNQSNSELTYFIILYK